MGYQMGRVMITVPILEGWSKQKTARALTATLTGYSEYLGYPFEVLVTPDTWNGSLFQPFPTYFIGNIKEFKYKG